MNKSGREIHYQGIRVTCRLENTKNKDESAKATTIQAFFFLKAGFVVSNSQNKSLMKDSILKEN